MSTSARSPWRRAAVLAAALVLLGGGLWYAFRPEPVPYNHASHLPEHLAEPVWMAATNATVREAYVFAAHNHDLLSQIPCWCGCGQIHNNNAECYYKRDAQLNITAYDDHAYG